MKARSLVLGFALLVSALAPVRVFGGEVLVAAASDLSVAAKELASRFEKDTGHAVKLSIGSSGNFFAQISNGAPFDVFLSADVDYVRRLEAAGLTEPGSSHVYAVGRIVLWTPKDSSLNLQALGMKALLQPQVRRVAIANPEVAPYGRAAVAAMEKAGVHASVKSKLVLGENIAQAAQFVQSGAADIGVIAHALALAEPMKRQGRFWEIPLDSYPRMDQAGVVLKQANKAGHGAAAQAFMSFLRSAEGRATLASHGFILPQARVVQPPDTKR